MRQQIFGLLPCFGFIHYNALIDSTGFFLAASHTGIKVASIAVRRAVPIIISIEKGPNTNIEAPSSAAIVSLRIEHIMVVPVVASNEHINAITKDSEKNILNTSAPLAPTALKIPISRLFCDIEVEIKLEKRSIANKANTSPT